MPDQRREPRPGFPRLPRRSRYLREAQRETFFVGRRPFEAPEVYVVTATGVNSLRSEQRLGTRELDWIAPGPPATELAHALLTAVVNEPQSEPLTVQFARDVISQFDGDGFVLSSAQILAWLRQCSGSPEQTAVPPLSNHPSRIGRAWRELLGPNAPGRRGAPPHEEPSDPQVHPGSIGGTPSETREPRA